MVHQFRYSIPIASCVMSNMRCVVGMTCNIWALETSECLAGFALIGALLIHPLAVGASHLPCMHSAPHLLEP